MKIKNFFFGINVLVLVAVSIFLDSCQWVTIELPPAQKIDVPEGYVYSFAKDIEPFFSNDGCDGCHGGASATKGLDLTLGNAYKSITKNGFTGAGMLDTINDDKSKIYYFPASAAHSGIKMYKSNHADIVLEWIKQGAKP